MRFVIPEKIKLEFTINKKRFTIKTKTQGERYVK